jgi:carbon-monoxide dehydrogenase medium subunit
MGSMKPPRFVYHDPTTLDEALDLLATYGDGAKVLAGGQSLMPLLNFRLARPDHLIDCNRIESLAHLVETDNALDCGAMIRQRTLERSPLVHRRAQLITQALPFVGHPQNRNRGTLGGSLAHADSAAELPAVIVALRARLTLRSSRSERSIDAEDFFIGQLTTILRPDELLTRIDIPFDQLRTGSALREVAKRRGDFALAGVATVLSLHDDSTIAAARIVCFGVGEGPVRVPEAEATLIGAIPAEPAFTEAGSIVSARIDPSDDIHASAGYRRRVAGVLARRALAASVPSPAQHAA